MKIIVSGAAGMLGHEVVRVFSEAGHEVVATDIANAPHVLDITDPEDVEAKFAHWQPEWVINCAAFTRVDDCETQESLAMTLNGDAPGILAAACRRNGAGLVHVSTDYVFPGTGEIPYSEEDSTGPLSAYGRTKLAGEEAVRRELPDGHIIVRTQWLFGIHGPNFVATILRLATERERIEVVDDQWGCPTYAPDLARAIRALVQVDARGLFHVCNRGNTTWHGFAAKAVELAGMTTEVAPVSTERFPRPAARPAFSVLSTKKFSRVTERLMPPWQIALQEYLDHWQKRSGRH